MFLKQLRSGAPISFIVAYDVYRLLNEYLERSEYDQSKSYKLESGLDFLKNAKRGEELFENRTICAETKFCESYIFAKKNGIVGEEIQRSASALQALIGGNQLDKEEVGYVLGTFTKLCDVF
jgi:hypothetical protein